MSVYYGNGLDAFVESIYLQEEIDPSVSSSIHVNPDNPTYITGKIVIINMTDYPAEKINTLVKNKCKVISRVFYDISEIEINPYIIQPCFDVMWNGKEGDIDGDNLEELLKNRKEDLEWSMIFPDYKLYFPKIVYSNKNYVIDSFGNLTYLGWISQQLGINLLGDNTPFKDLDLIKTKKIDFMS